MEPARTQVHVTMCFVGGRLGAGRQVSDDCVGRGCTTLWEAMSLHRGFFGVRISAKEGGLLDHVDTGLLPRPWCFFVLTMLSRNPCWASSWLLPGKVI